MQLVLGIVFSIVMHLKNDFVAEILYSIILLYGTSISIFIIYFLINFFGINKVPRKIILLSIIPLIVQALALVENIFNNTYFKIENGTLIYGSLYNLHAIILIFNLFICLVISFLKRKNVSKYEYRAILFTAVLLSIPLTANLFVRNVIMFWNMIASIIIVFYIIMQEKLVEYDTLTQATSMQYFNTFTLRKLINTNKKYIIALLDVDNLTAINNTFGYEEGDLVLKKIVETIIKVKREEDRVVRLVGDKFVIIFDTDDLTKVSKVIKNLEEEIGNYNKESYKKYNIEFTLFYENYDSTTKLFSDIIRKLTSYIYDIKKAKLIEYEKMYKK